MAKKEGEGRCPVFARIRSGQVRSGPETCSSNYPYTADRSEIILRHNTQILNPRLSILVGIGVERECV